MSDDEKELERKLRLTPSFQWDSIRTLQERYSELKKKYDSIEKRYETKRDTIFKLGEVQNEMDEKQNERIELLEEGLKNEQNPGLHVKFNLLMRLLKETNERISLILTPSKCSECGGYRMGEYMTHNDGCSKSSTTTSTPKKDGAISIINNTLNRLKKLLEDLGELK